MTPSSNSTLGQFYPHNRQEWRQWLEKNHTSSSGIWIIYFKKGSQEPTVSYDDAVEEALSFGWIDSTVNKLDEERYMQLFTPRNPGSTWSRLNKQRVEKILAEGLMTPAGWKKIEAAKKDGSWDFLNDIDDLIIPEDLKRALNENKGAMEYFNSYTDSVKKQILWWIKSAKRPDTRNRRIQKIVKHTLNEEPPF